jgi:predicted DNA-binding antitoxin AbrB/MazE fold protein
MVDDITKMTFGIYTMTSIKAIYYQGQFRPLEAVLLLEGQHVELSFVATDDIVLDSLIGDMLATFGDSTKQAQPDEALLFEKLDAELAGKRPLSEIILDDRQ